MSRRPCGGHPETIAQEVPGRWPAEGTIPGVTEPGGPALSLDGLEAVVFDTDGVLTDTASVHAAAWKRLFDEYLTLRASRGQAPFRPFEAADYLRSIDGRPRYDGVAGFLASRGIQLPWGDPSDPPDRETVCGLGNAKDRYFVAHLLEHGARPFPTSVAFVGRLRERGLRTAAVSAVPERTPSTATRWGTFTSASRATSRTGAVRRARTSSRAWPPPPFPTAGCPRSRTSCGSPRTCSRRDRRPRCACSAPHSSSSPNSHSCRPS